MSENASSNINQILTSYDTFINILEDPNWPKSAKVEDIKMSFKLGSFLEKTMKHFESQNSSDEFLDILGKWWKEKNRTKIYSTSFYSTACDELLMKFFRCENISENNLDVPVRIFTSIFPKNRMENVISKLILTAGYQEAVSDFVKIISDDKNFHDLQYHLKLQNWSELMETGKESYIREEVKEILTLYKVESLLHLIIGVLTLSDVSETEKLVQKIALQSILDKMLDRSILSKQFWTTLFKNVDVRHFECTRGYPFHSSIEIRC
ncbi:ubiquitin-fold modifier 1 isoform X1 [Leptinotarsa decemlineata]|uniref:ubiquitin-fold modifier 1 isoform X1 n=1 Tax=Leptinotarsa decemlineata TaxID=7539 RepID=UPI003D3080B4